MADIELDRVSIQFGSFTAVHEISLKIHSGEFFSFLGPSGCGKTTLLRAISGFKEPTSGAVRIGGKDMSGIGPNKRPTALIFQNLALFPMMSVAENVAYGLRVRGVSRSEREARALRLLDQVALAQHAGKRVSELSGGQRQRVAVARALAVEPSVLLLDEPLSALDLKLRQYMRRELREIQKRVGITFVYITHDQGEALTMSDRIAVMSAGRIEQVGSGRDVYVNPQTPFVASFVGESNAFKGTIVRTDGDFAEVTTSVGLLRGRNPRSLSVGQEAILFIRPELLRVRPAEADCRFRASLQQIDYEGHMVHATLQAAENTRCIASIVVAGDADSLQGELELGFDASQAIVLPK